MFYSIVFPYLSGDLILAQVRSGYAETGPLLTLNLISYLISCFFYQKILQRLNVANDWLAWVPIANCWIILKAGDQSPWWILPLFIPLFIPLGLIFLIIAMVNIVKKLGKSPWLLWLLIVPLANFWLLYHLAFQ
jgi:hypothetical protein